MNRILQNAFNASKDIPAIDVYTGLKRKVGSSIFVTCPKCNCYKLDKCAVYENIFYCFKCGVSSNAVDVYSVQNNISKDIAAVELAYIYKKISKEDYLYYTNKTENDLNIKQIDGCENKKNTIAINNKRNKNKNPIITDIVYSALLRMNEFKLSDDMILYLKNNRMLSDNEINNNDFFQYKIPFSIEALMNEIHKTNPAFNICNLKDVAGFYFEIDFNKKNNGSWKFIHPNNNTLGIVCRDEEERIVALQQRGIYGSSRYFWISSLKENKKDNRMYGSGSGSQYAVVYPDEIKDDRIIITEGKFKAIAFSKKYNCVSISMQGVNAYKNICNKINDIYKSEKIRRSGYKFENKIIYIGFDADIVKNDNVYDAMVKMGEFIRSKIKNVKVRVFLWDYKYGKGFDDYINNKNAGKCISVPFETVSNSISDIEKILNYAERKQT